MNGARTILVVEDNSMNQYLLVRQLARLGHTDVVVVGNGEDALRWLDHNRCRVVLTDCQMPVMDGYRMTRTIREREYRSGNHTPVIALSAGVLADDRSRCLDAGMDDHVAKPAQLATLERALRPWLGQDELHQTSAS
jgi:two-component system, sensor histidine kinase and response regulator